MSTDEFSAAVADIEAITQALVMSSGDVLAMRQPDQHAIAVQLVQGGLRFDPEVQTHKWIGSGIGGGVWAPLNEVPASEDVVPDISGLSVEQKTALLGQLTELGFGGPGTPPPFGGDAFVSGGESE